jgi:16S rRNA (guanine966-N2)-methyltransferase
VTRIIAGFAGSREIAVPKSGTRPTSDRVREAIFSALDARDSITDAHVLDLFAGSGSLGIEALSRGAASTLFVEQNRAATDVLRANLQKARLQNATLRQGDVFKTLADLAKNADLSKFIL